MNYEQLRAEKMAALKSKDTVKNNVVTMLLSGMTYLKKEVDYLTPMDFNADPAIEIFGSYEAMNSYLY